MSRLIDADKLIRAMYVRYDEKVNNVPDNLAEGFMQVDKLIKEQPTAFDVDNVVEKLEEVQFTAELEEYILAETNVTELFETQVVQLDEAIEIVKAGGRDGKI